MAHTRPSSGQDGEDAIERLRFELEACRRELDTCRQRLKAQEPREAGLATTAPPTERAPVPQRDDERFRRIFDAVPGMVCVLNPAGEVELLNQQVLRYFGRTLAELKDWAMLDAIHPEDLDGVVEAWKHSVRTGEPFDREQRQRRADGVYRWQHSRADPVRDAEGHVTAWYMLITDIDDLRRAEAALRQHQAYLKEAQHLSHTGSFGWKVRTGEVVWSAETFRIMGYDQMAHPTLGLILDRVHPGDLGLVEQVMGRASLDLVDIDFEHRLLMPDGAVKHVQVVAHAIKDRAGSVEFLGALMDITERKRATENLERALVQLRNSEAQFRTMLNAMPTQAWGTLADGTTEFQNQQWLDYVGLSADWAKGWAWREAIHPDDVENYVNRWSEIQASGAAGEAEARFRRHDGVYRRFLMRVVPLRNEHGEIVRWYGTNTDIEDLKQTADALRRSEQFARDQSDALRRILDALAHESSPDRIVEHVLRTLTEHLRAHSCSVWSRNAGTGLLHFGFSFVAGEFRTEADVRFASSFPSERGAEIWPGIDIFNSGRPQIVADIREGPDFPWRADLLAQGVVTVLVVPMLVAGRVQGVVGIRFDRKRLFQPEEINLAQTLANQAMLALQLSRISAQSRQTAVLAERNRLARDIHDTLAQGFTGVIVQLEAAADATSRGLTAEAGEHLQRAGDLARLSLKDARRSVQALRPQALEQQDLGEALDDMIRKMTARTALKTRFEVTGAPRSLPFDWEENLLRIGQEVLTNALRHAQANEFVVRLAFAPGEIRLDLRDNGRGFDASQRHDGFGLLGIRERVEQMGGQLTINTAAGQGTATLIVLPLANIPKSSAP